MVFRCLRMPFFLGPTLLGPRLVGNGTLALLTVSQTLFGTPTCWSWDHAVATPWEPSLREPPSALRPHGTPTLALAGLALRGQRPVIWFLGLILFSAPVSAMVEAPTYAFNAFHVGLFPWRRAAPDGHSGRC